MRASEFSDVTEGKASDWFGKAVGKLEQNDINARIKKVLPSIVSTIRDDIAEKVNKILQDKSKSDGTKSQLILKIVPHIIGSLLKTKLGKEDDADLHTILKSIQSDPTGIAHNETISLALQKIAVRMFKDPEFFDTDDKKKDKDKDDDKKKDDEQAADDKDEEPSDEEIVDIPKPEESITIDDVTDGIKDYIMNKRGNLDVNNRDEVDDFIWHNLEHHFDLEQPGAEEELTAVKEKLMQDPEMPFNHAPKKQFRGLVYSPGGIRYSTGDSTANVAYVRSKGIWTRWEIGPRSAWRYMEKVADYDLKKSLETLAKSASGDLVPLSFRFDDVEGQKNLYRVTTR